MSDPLAASSASVPPPSSVGCPGCAYRDNKLDGVSEMFSNLAVKHDAFRKASLENDALLNRVIQERNELRREVEELQAKVDRLSLVIE